jgi:hypothetical protein
MDVAFASIYFSRDFANYLLVPNSEEKSWLQYHQIPIQEFTTFDFVTKDETSIALLEPKTSGKHKLQNSVVKNASTYSKGASFNSMQALTP